MENSKNKLSRYISPKTPPSVRFEFAGETYACDPSITEIEVPHVSVFIPRGVIREYNRTVLGKKSVALPNPNKLWEFLYPKLLGHGLTGRDVFGSENDVDELLKELSDWPKNAWYEQLPRNSKGVVLEVKAYYDPYWDEKEN